MLTGKIKEALSRARLVCAEKTVSPEEIYGPEKESYEQLHKAEMARAVIEAAVTRHMTDGCVQFDFAHGPYPGVYLSEGLLKAGIVVMSPKDFNELRRLIKDLSEDYEYLSER
jgi:hypothetical protein